LTEQGVKDIKNSPGRIEAARKGIQGSGGKMIAMYSVMGEYDYVAIVEYPNDEAGMAFLMTLGSMGNVRTKTLKAFTEKEFADIVKKTP
jgi:uncharacterized protein with GYD domain